MLQGETLTSEASPKVTTSGSTRLRFVIHAWRRVTGKACMVLIERGLVPELLLRVFFKFALALSVVSVSCKVFL